MNQSEPLIAIRESTMVSDNEVIMLLIGLTGLIFIYCNYQQFRKIPNWQALLTAFFLFLAGIVFTVLETICFHETINFLEHLAYLMSSFIFMVWSWLFLHGKERSE